MRCCFTFFDTVNCMLLKRHVSRYPFGCTKLQSMRVLMATCIDEHVINIVGKLSNIFASKNAKLMYFPHFGKILWTKIEILSTQYRICVVSCISENCDFLPRLLFLTHDAAAAGGSTVGHEELPGCAGWLGVVLTVSRVDDGSCCCSGCAVIDCILHGRPHDVTPASQ